MREFSYNRKKGKIATVVKYQMKDAFLPVHPIARLLRSMPVIQDMMANQQFTVVATVYLNDWARWEEATAFALSPDIRRKSKRILDVDRRVAKWEFESATDAMKFRLMFG